MVVSQTVCLVLLNFLLLASAATTKNALEIKADSNEQWWQNAVFYQVYPCTFQDTDKDGFGDLQGVIQRLPHLKSLGVDAIWLSPIFDSPQVDSGYDISDYYEIYAPYGTKTDLKNLIAKAKEQDIKIILDFVPNHTSDKHAWFELSENKTQGYEDYYVWENGANNDDSTPPNNWISIFGGPAWTYSSIREQFYLHQFSKGQPDLNYRSETVAKAMKDVLKYWLDFGVDGFRMDAVPFLFEDENLTDEPRSYNPSVDDQSSDYLVHTYTQNQDETFDMIYQWREVLDTYQNKVMMTEAYADIKNTMKYYGSGTRNGAHFTFNFLLITDLNEQSNAHDFVYTIDKWIAYMPKQYTPNWVLGNHDNHRVATRYGSKQVDGLAMLELLLPGVGVVYNGEEIGMEDGYVSFEDTRDPSALVLGPENYTLVSRDPERTPMQWDNTTYAGFTDESTPENSLWLPVSDKKTETNVAKQMTDEESHLKVYQSIINLKKNKTFHEGVLQVEALSDNVLVMMRILVKEEAYAVIFNLGDSSETISLAAFPLPSFKGKVVIASVGASIKKTAEVDLQNFKVGGHESYTIHIPLNLTSSAQNTLISSLLLLFVSVFVFLR